MAQFSLFPRLPPEIRHQIWLEALSKHSEPGESPLFYFKKGCWRFRYLKPGEPGWEPGDSNLHLEFEHDRLDPLRYDLPLFHVNWEARSAARLWAKSRGVKEDAPLLITRSFDADWDTLYVPEEDFTPFIAEPAEKPFDEEISVTFGSSGPYWRRLALPVGLLKNDPMVLADLSMDYFSIRRVYVIVVAEPDELWQVQGTDCGGQQWWEVQSLEGAPGASFYCDDGKEFLWRGYTPELDRYGLNDVFGPVATEMIKNDGTRWNGLFEIRPVRVVRECI